MSLNTILVSALVGIVTSAITAYVTTRLKLKEEKQRWQRDFAVKYFEVQTADPTLAQKMAMQFGIGFVKYRTDDPEPQKVFVLPNCRVVVGRMPDNAISIPDNRALTRHHCAFVADDVDVFIEHFGSTNGTFLNGERVNEKRKLQTGDVVAAAGIEFTFFKLPGR